MKDVIAIFHFDVIYSSLMSYVTMSALNMYHLTFIIFLCTGQRSKLYTQNL